ncbi:MULTISPECIES: plasmid partitioning protein RepB C-terminal domain-containing protein [unclassified Paracoccus (in: a-proteobacteria)]|uniref:plasmid partitioning protein RepB C-terminal domain-containing protein n=1 Tax=unclassified Paracoccus (in: a-proteobacteria) TaxID=2688777 RepID=UPI001F31D32B|nr:plasmid partitioning protein RepB C-terminal domain-containing protein [Paracoccus sp. MC1862]
MSTEYVSMIAGLLEKGEERLVSAVETGVLPLNLAIQISKTDAKGAQKALMDAYTQNKLRGRKLALVRRLIQQRELRGPQIQNNPIGRRGAKRALTSEGLVRAYQQEATRQKLLLKNCSGSGPPVRSRNSLCYRRERRAVADCLLEGLTPLKNVAHGSMRT